MNDDSRAPDPMSDDTDAPSDELEPAEPSAADIRTLRLQKLERLRADGGHVYPYRFDRDRTLAELRAEFDGVLGDGDETEVEVAVAGRLMIKREQGRLTFGSLRDRDGEVQLFVSQGVLGKEAFAAFNDLDRGDWVGAVGTVMKTRKGELSVKVARFELLSKALRPLPDKWKGLSDVDQRYRQRYVDLIVNDEARATLMVRINAVQAIRDRLRDRGYLEVETPVLNLVQGGATARPFVTHYNALDIDTYLRIALELPLKRLIVGGMEKVFEIGRIFRNEGLDTRHNPEFTMLETYEAFVDYTEMMELLEDLVASAATAAIGTTKVFLRGQEIELAPPYRRATMIELIATHAGVDVHPTMPVDELRAVLDGLDVSYDPPVGPGPAGHGALRREGRARADRAHLRHRLPARGVPARQAAPRRPGAGRALRAGRGRARAGQRVQRAERPRRPARSLPGRGGRQGRRRSRGRRRRPRLRACPRVRHASGRLAWAWGSTASR